TDGPSFTIRSGIPMDGPVFAFTPNGIGTYVVTAIVVDKDGGATAVSRTLTVTAVAVQGADLAVGGTMGSDIITVGPGRQAGSFKVSVGSTTQDNLSLSGTVRVYGLDGGDQITISAAPAGGLIVDGQGGADKYTVNFGQLGGIVTVNNSDAANVDQLTFNG